MKIIDFEKELQAIDKDLSIRQNHPPQRVIDAFPDVLKIATVTYQGAEICTLPAEEIFDEKNNSYGLDIRDNGHFTPHRTRPEILNIVNAKLELLKNNKTEADAFFGRGEYSDAALKTQGKGTVELVEEVPIELKEING